jgi:pimeloyl-ACP methyl ester carboxylesterase
MLQRSARFVRGMGILVAGLIVLVLAASLVVRQVAEHRATRDFPPPGILVTFDDRRSHIRCMGSGAPTVVLESGLDDRGSWGWDHLLDDLARTTRVCAYDRAGFLWSEPRSGPRDAERIARELHALLGAAAEPPPYLMVGHSLGGLLVRVYDGTYPGEVAGFVFVDASHPEQDRRFPEEVRRQIQERKGEPDRRWIMRLVAPYRIFAPERPTARTAYYWRSFPDGVLREVREIDRMSEQAGGTVSFGDRPVVVLTAGIELEMPGLSAEANAGMRREWLQLHRELAGLSTNADHRIVDGGGHYVHWDRPEAVIEAIRDVVSAVRTGEAVRREDRDLPDGSG